MKHDINGLARKTSPKRATNVSLSADLIEAAKELDINVSQSCERGLAADVKAAREARWLEENREALDSWNDYVEKNGLPLARFRQF
ncbi:MAG: type II toxin-antitoxin system CcdA family antitoxin [Sphingomonadaceae bacterium]